MSMRDYAVNDFGVVFDEEMLIAMANKKNIEYDKEDIDCYDIADHFGFEYISEFTGEATRVYPDGTFDRKTSLIFNNDAVYYLPLMKSSTLFNAAYDSIEDIVAEVAERIGEFLPDDFNCKDNIRNIVGTYYG